MSGDKNHNFLNWLGYTTKPNWNKNRRIGGFFGALFLIIVVVLFLGALAATFAVFYKIILGESAPSLGVGALIAALLGSPFVIWATWLKHQTTHYQKESHITDNINKAVEMLSVMREVKKKDSDGTIIEISEPNIEVRLGGILSLERIAQNSTKYDNGRDHVRVMEILCAYIRENAPASSAYELEEGENWKKDREKIEAKHEWPARRIDIETALKVIGRRNKAQLKVEAAWPNIPDADTIWPFENPEGKNFFQLKKKYSGYRLDLRAINLQFANLYKLNFSGANIQNSRLECAILRQIEFNGANLSLTHMQGANLSEAKMHKANLWDANLQRAELNGANMQGARLMHANMKGADLFGANMKGADLFGANMKGADLFGVNLDDVMNLTLSQIEHSYTFEAKFSQNIDKAELAKNTFRYRNQYRDYFKKHKEILDASKKEV